MGRIAVLFPGIGYNNNKPLLHYAAQIAKKYDFEIAALEYSGFPEGVRGDKEKMQQCFDIAYKQTQEKLEKYDFSKYEDVLFIGKSVGTAVAAAYADNKKINARMVLYTPVLQTFNSNIINAIVFHGNSDPWAVTKKIKDSCAKQKLEVNIIPDANHSLETGDTETDVKNLSVIMKKTESYIAKMSNPNLNQAINPYMPSWEYVPDGEPYVFDGRVYVYGSHDKFRGDVYCMLDYICYSAPIEDLGNWRFEGVIYKKTQDPDNTDGSGMLYAPDVAKGPDGRYYLYYAINTSNHISVAVCDEPGGKYEFYGYVKYRSGIRLGDKEADEMQFDPGVLVEDGKVYLYTGFCPIGMKERHGAMMSVLDADMITITQDPVFVAPSEVYSEADTDDFLAGIAAGSLHNCTYLEGDLRKGFKNHEFFEAPSMRKIMGKYYFIYSSRQFHELCYAISDNPAGPFEYKGVIVSNGDEHIGSYKDAGKFTSNYANNHGSIEKINDDYYIFYHRHTNGTNYSRQGCFEKLSLNEDGTINQAMITSCCSIKPLNAEGLYPAYIACNLFAPDGNQFVPWIGWMGDENPIITQEGSDGDENFGYIANMKDGATVGFKYFDCRDVKRMAVTTKGYGDGEMEIRTSLDGDVCGKVSLDQDNVWVRREFDVDIPDGVNDLYITYRGGANCSLREFEFIK